MGLLDGGTMMKESEIIGDECMFCENQGTKLIGMPDGETAWICEECSQGMEDDVDLRESVVCPEIKISVQKEEKKFNVKRKSKKSVSKILSKHAPNISSNLDKKSAFVEINTEEDMRARAAQDALFARMSDAERERLSSWCTTARISGVVRGDQNV